MAIAAVKSAVDVKQVPWNVFASAYGEQLQKMNIPPEKQREYKAAARELYKELREGDVVLMDDDSPAPALPAGFIAPGEILFSSW